jgi:hypothetical protein
MTLTGNTILITVGEAFAHHFMDGRTAEIAARGFISGGRFSASGQRSVLMMTPA